MLMLPGLFMMLTPLLPGIPYMFLMATLYGVLDGFQSFSPWMIAVFGGFVILAGLVDYFAGVLGARYGGARSYSLKLGFIGMILGTVIVPPFGSFVGLFLGIVAGEVFRIGWRLPALLAGGISLTGALIGYIINILLALAFLITFLIVLF